MVIGITDHKILSVQHGIGKLHTVKNRGGCQQQRASNFGAAHNYDQECKHGNAIHIMEVDMAYIKMTYCMHQ